MKHSAILFFACILISQNVRCQFNIIANPLGNKQAANTRVINSMCFTQDGSLFFATNSNDGSSFNQTPSTGFYSFSNGRWNSKKLGNANSFEEYFNISISPNGRTFAMNSVVVTTGAYRKLVILESIGDGKCRELATNLPMIGLYSHLAFDSKSNLWFGILAGKMIQNEGNITLCKYTDGNVVNFTTKNCFTMSHFVFGKDDILISNNGLNYLYEFNENIDANKQKVITNNLKSNSKNVMNSKDGSLWYESESNQEIINIDNGIETIYKLPVEIGDLNCIFLDKKENLFLGTSNGLMILSKKQWKVYSTENSNISGNNITAIKEDSKGNIWLAGNQKKSGYLIENIGTFVCHFVYQ